MGNFYALVHHEKGSAFGISFPDVPGCFGAADREDDVIGAAQEALSLFAADGGVLPKARTLDALTKDREIAAELKSGAILIGVTLIESQRKRRYNIMLDPALSAETEKAARRSGSSKSDYIALALEERLRRDSGVIVRDKRGAIVRDGSTGEFVKSGSKRSGGSSAKKRA